VARALESLRACEDVLILDRGSTDGLADTAREFGARVVPANSDLSITSYLEHARHSWILCLRTTEAVGESLEASLYEFILSEPNASQSFAVGFQEETASGWETRPAETRLVHRSFPKWERDLPVHDEASVALEGYLLRLRLP
jgi:glycosyltransferase involved in cell wall biosynthesis